MYSYKDFTGRSLKSHSIPPDTVIDRSCFSQEVLDSDIFPDGMTGVTFIGCNLDNCYIPPGNTLVNCSNRRYTVINGENWRVDNNNNPVEII